jgi:diadenosine tetraphosphate (Ap4A) HIT family hydrolase
MKNCIFCKVALGEIQSWKVHETDMAYAFLYRRNVMGCITL